ncbi:hypothetical protein H257_16100 [Aphanomyces astaci]|uniref:Sulfatase-modifying factor enzyme domain-containing protein n=1 Tax=Aphanomyces astaci TaxID=112090 RepID=W4FM15_APHAT|nr:hypothetical protein H257_16100 [Aphanomyces astaci]ETV67738.1 hypothetical protein H257_16100 [Aphanomyces astaci]|eukprot:XP_009842731.1 hypothetical protein H257_16100 [Aphanomyces astaci]
MLLITAFPRRFITAKARSKVLVVSTMAPSPSHRRQVHSTSAAVSDLVTSNRFQDAARKHVHARTKPVNERPQRHHHHDDLHPSSTSSSMSSVNLTFSGLYPEPLWYTTSPRTPCNDPSFPGLVDGQLHSIAMPNLTTCTRQDVVDYFDNTWALTDMLFSSFQSEAAFVQPPPHQLRHPMAFYYGHPTCFYINKCRLAGLLDQPVNAAFEDLFEVGVDEMRWDDMSKNEKEWPSVACVQAYRRQVYGVIKGLLESHADFADGHGPITAASQSWALFMAMEHERIHLETSSVLMQEHAVDNFVQPDTFPSYHPSASRPRSAKVPVEGTDYPVNRMIQVATHDGRPHVVTLGKPSSFPSFGWDNEYGAKTVAVASPFAASSQLVSNGAFWQFVKDGGYLNQKLWSVTGWAWRSFRNTKWPQFWRPDGPQGSHEYRLRALFDEIDMQWDWPVQVNLHEAQAFCRWKNQQDDNIASEYYHVITEPMHQLLRNDLDKSNPITSSTTFQDAILNHLPRHTTMATTDDAPQRNTNVSFASFSPVDSMAPNDQGFHDVFGNAWEWCQDHMSALPGFKVHPVYDDFTLPCFDGEHHVIMGGSFMSSGGNGASKFSRFHFRPHFFQHAGFRVVSSAVTTTTDGDQVVDVMTSCVNAPEPHTVVNPFRTSSTFVLHPSKVSSVFLTKLEAQAATQWRDFGAGYDNVHVVLPGDDSIQVEKLERKGEHVGSVLLVVPSALDGQLDKDDEWERVKEGVLPHVEKEGSDVRRVSMVHVSAWSQRSTSTS